jgi:hypothetical protein
MLFLLTAATDGHLALWNTNAHAKQIVPVNSSPGPNALSVFATSDQIHQSSIKSWHIMELTSSTYLVCTGGDDNAMALTLIIINTTSDSPKPIEASIQSFIAPKAHAGAITAVRLWKVESQQAVSEAEKTQFRVVTVGADQRIKSWRLELQGDGLQGLKTTLISDEFTSIADPGCMDTLDSSDTDCSQNSQPSEIIVCGIGMECRKLDFTSKMTRG